MIKNYIINILIFFLSIFIGTILITLLHYFSIFNTGIINVLKILLPIISIFISSFRIGKKAMKKGYLEGLKFGTCIILLLLIISLILNSFQLKILIFYIILLVSSMLGGMIGILKKTNNS